MGAPEIRHPAAERRQLSRQRQERRALAGPVRTEKRHHLPGGDGQVEVADGGQPAVARAQVLHFQHDVAPRAPRPAGRRGRLLRAEVAGHDYGIAGDVVRVALSDLDAEVQHGDAVAGLQHERNVVLHQEHGQPPLVGQPADEPRQLASLLEVEPGRGLVEQQHRRAGGDGPCDRDQPPVSVRQLVRAQSSSSSSPNS